MTLSTDHLFAHIALLPPGEQAEPCLHAEEADLTPSHVLLHRSIQGKSRKIQHVSKKTIQSVQKKVSSFVAHIIFYYLEISIFKTLREKSDILLDAKWKQIWFYRTKIPRKLGRKYIEWRIPLVSFANFVQQKFCWKPHSNIWKIYLQN